MSRALSIVDMCVLFAMGTAGCIPIPNTRIEGKGIKSCVIDAATGLPVAKATIRDPADGMTTTTASDGSFFLKPHIQLHWAYLCGPLSYPIWPFTYDLAPAGRQFRVEAAGYVAREFDLEIGRTRDQDIHFADPNRDILIVPPLGLEKVAPTRAYKASTRPTAP